MMDDINQLVYWNDLMNEDVEVAEEDWHIARDVLPRSNPFDISDRKFVQMFRLSKHLVREVVEMVTPFMEPTRRASALTITTKVLAALRFYASGSHQEITGSNHFVAISQLSMSRAIQEVTNALNQPQILNVKVQFPKTVAAQETLRTRQAKEYYSDTTVVWLRLYLPHFVTNDFRFFQRHQFPGIIGVIDCTHVAIIPPKTNDPDYPEHIYVNRKNYHSLNVQLVCDLDLKIMNVNARFPGSTHDAFIWGRSPVNLFLERMYRRHPENIFFLLDDSGYPTRPWLLTPLPTIETPGEEIFNHRLSSIRSTIERCNGVLKNRFRCLLRYRTLHYHPTVAGKIVNACCVLHNICIANNIAEIDEPHPEQPDYGMYVVEHGEPVPRRMVQNHDLATARQNKCIRLNVRFLRS